MHTVIVGVRDLGPPEVVANCAYADPWVLAVVATPEGWCAVTTYSLRIRPDLLQVFWAGMQAGDFLTDAVMPLGVDRRTGTRILVAAGGVRPRRGRDLKGRCLTFADRAPAACTGGYAHMLEERAQRSMSDKGRPVSSSPWFALTLRGFSAEEPAFWRSGYRPHLTLSPTITVAEGDSRNLCCVAIAQLRDHDATIVARFDLV